MSVQISGDHSLQWKASIDLSALNEQVGEINKSLGRVGTQLKSQTEEIDRFSRNAANAIKTYLSVTAISGFVQSIVKIRGEFQQLEVAFETILSSKQKADDLMAQVVELAAKTPFGLEDAAKGAKQLLAYGFAADKVKDTLTTLGNVASGVGAPLNDIVYLYGTLRTQGRAYQKDIMQFTGRGIPIIAELAKQFGVAEGEVNKLVEAGKVGFPEIEKAFQSLTSEGGVFNNLMEKQSQTISGLISNFGDAWETMLNDIGKSQEGPIADIIKGSISIVENYQKVLDLLKVLIITYGAYRAAVIATAIAQTVASNTTKGWTVAQMLHYRALLLSEKAMKLLNAAMLTNPYVAVTTAVVGLIAVLKIFNQQTDQVRSKQQLLNESSEKLNESLAEQKSKIAPLVEAVKQGNLTEQERISIYNKLNGISPKLVEGISAQTLSYDALTKNVNKYLDVLRDQIKQEANASAIRESITNENKLQKQFEDQKKYVEKLEQLQNTSGFKATQGASNVFVNAAQLENAKKQLAQLEDAQKRQKEVTEQLAKDSADLQKNEGDVKIRQNKEYWENILKEAQAGYEALTELEIKQGKGREFLSRIAQAKEQLKIYDLTGKSVKSMQREEDKYNSMLEKRGKIIVDISEIERRANQTGLLQRQRDLDSINEKYDQQLQSVKDINKEIERYNEKHPDKKVPLLGNSETIRIEAARQVELANFNYREDADNYIQSIEAKKIAFEELKKAQDTGNHEIIESAKKLYSDQTNGFEDYVQYLKGELAKIFNDVISGNADLSKLIKFEEITQRIKDAFGAVAQETKSKQLDAVSALLGIADSYNTKRSAIEVQYTDLYNALQKQRTSITQSEYNKRKKILEDQRKQEEANLNVTESSLFKKMTVDLIGASKEQLRDLIKEFDKVIKSGEMIGADGKKMSIPPEALESLKRYREQLLGLTGDVGDAIDSFSKLTNMMNVFSTVSSGLRNIASGIDDYNDGLKDSLETMADLTDALGQVAGAAAIVGGVSSGRMTNQQAGSAAASIGGWVAAGAAIGSAFAGVGAVVGAAVGAVVGGVAAIIKGGKKVRESLEKMYAEFYRFQVTMEIGEYKITQLQRQRLLLKAQENKLTWENVEAQKEALKLNQAQAKSEEERVLSQLQNEMYISGQKQDKYGGFLGLWRKSRAENVYTSLLGKTIEEIESLYEKGQLDGRAKELFEQLRQLQQEGKDIHVQLESLKREANELLTGTTEQTLSDTIIDGFKNGLRSASDFADSFEDMMRNAMLNSLKFKYLEAPLQNFYEQFAMSVDSDGVLTASEIDDLRSMYENITDSALKQLEQLQEISGINLNNVAGGNSIAGAIKGMTEQQAELLAGQFGGLRITAIEQLRVATSGLSALQNIENNTYAIHEVARQVTAVKDALRRFELNGLKVV